MAGWLHSPRLLLSSCKICAMELMLLPQVDLVAYCTRKSKHRERLLGMLSRRWHLTFVRYEMLKVHYRLGCVSRHIGHIRLGTVISRELRGRKPTLKCPMGCVSRQNRRGRQRSLTSSCFVFSAFRLWPRSGQWLVSDCGCALGSCLHFRPSVLPAIMDCIFSNC